MSELKTMDLDDFSFFFSFLFLFLLFIIVEGYFIKRSRGTKLWHMSQGGHITVTRSRDREKDVEGSRRRRYHTA